MKLLLKIIRTFTIGLIWSWFYFVIVNYILINFWNFSTISASSWHLLNSYWESGGVIRSGKDYLLITILIFYIPFWLWGWRLLTNISYLTILIIPIQWYNNRIIHKYGASSPRILLKNMGRSKKIEEEIEEMSKPKTQNKTDEEVNKIRNAVADKINSVKHS